VKGQCNSIRFRLLSKCLEDRDSIGTCHPVVFPVTQAEGIDPRWCRVRATNGKCLKVKCEIERHVEPRIQSVDVEQDIYTQTFAATSNLVPESGISGEKELVFIIRLDCIIHNS
jgi:hypothetical protein